MKSNIFKSEQKNDRFQMTDTQNSAENDIPRTTQRREHRRDDRPRDTRQFEGRNAFASGEKKVKKEEFKMDDENFPSLLIDDKIESKVETMNFASATKKERVQEDTTLEIDKVPPGWVRISMGADRKFVYEYGESSNIDYDERYEQEIINDEINCMIRRWAKYKEAYLELYGEEEYEKYFMPYNPYNTEDDEYEEYD